MKKTQTSLVLGLLLTLAGGFTPTVHAESSPASEKANAALSTKIEALLKSLNSQKITLSDFAIQPLTIQPLDLSSFKFRSFNFSTFDITPLTIEFPSFTSPDFKNYGFQRANFTAADLAGANLSGINLSKATFVGADLTGANLSGANLSGANLTKANLANANLTGANLTSVDLTKANLAGVVGLTTEQTQAKAGTASKTTKGELSGVVVVVDPDTKTITLKNNDGTYTVKVEDSTTLTAKDGTPVKLSDLKPGEELTANVLFTELPNGQIQVALVSAVRQQQATAQAQGTGNSGGTAKSNPFGNTPANTSNIDGRPVSPHQ